MKFSRNPVSGQLESYSDECIFAGPVLTMADLIGNDFAQDGGKGSGNFGHLGNPPNVGGSGAGSGGGAKEPTEQKSGVRLANKLKAEFDKLPVEVGNPFKLSLKELRAGKGNDKRGLMCNFFRLGNEIVDKMSEKDMGDVYYHYLDVLRTNGNPEKTNKKPLHSQYKLTEDGLLSGIPEKKARKYEKELNKYMGDNWKKANFDTLEGFIQDCPFVFQGALARGIHVKKEVAEKLLKELESGVVSFGRVTSWSGTYRTAMGFAANDDDNKAIGDDEVAIVFHIPAKNSRTAVPVAPFGRYKENECLMSGKSSYSVVSVAEDDFLTGHDMDPLVKGYRVCLIERGEEYDES